MATETSENNDKVALLLGKPKNTDTFKLYSGQGDDATEIELKLEALSSKDYDKLISKYPPNEADAAKGMTYDLDKFAPALISACLIDPELSLMQAKQLWSGDNWSRGDVEGLYNRVLRLNHRDSTVPFTGRG